MSIETEQAPKTMLNEGQKRVYSEILSFCSIKNKRPLLIEGAGGTGKTFTICKAINDLNIPEERILFLSPSHKANEVLRANLRRENIGADVQTLHAFFGWKQERNAKNELLTVYSPASVIIERVAKYDLIIIDEVSLIDNGISEKIEHFFIGSVNTILTGDSYQLPPVQTDEEGEEGEDGAVEGIRVNGNGRRISKVFDFSFCNKLTLTQNMRSENKTLSLLCELVREKIHTSTNASVNVWEWQRKEVNKLFSKLTTANEEGLNKVLNDFNTASLGRAELVRFFNETSDGKTSIFLGGTNRYISQKNFETRLKLSQKKYFDLKKIEAGETVLVLKTISIKHPEDERDVLRIPASTLHEVREVKEGSKEFYFNGNKYTLSGLFIQLKNYEFIDLFNINKSDPEYKRLQGAKYRLKNAKSIRAEEKKKQYNKIDRFFNECLNFSHSYALTVHRSQGSTFQRVHVNINSINSINAVDFWQMLYVAISRAREVLLISYDDGIIDTNFNRTFTQLERGFICNEKGAKCYISGEPINDYDFEVEHIFPRNLLSYYRLLQLEYKSVYLPNRQSMDLNFASIIGDYYAEIEDELNSTPELSGFKIKFPNLERNENGDKLPINFIFVNKLHSLINLHPVKKEYHAIKTKAEIKLKSKYETKIKNLFS